MKEAVHLDVCLRGLSAFVFLCINSGGGYWHCSLEEYAGTFLTTVLDRDSGHQQFTVNRSLEHSTGTLSNSGSVLVVIKCTQENKSGDPSCPQEKVTGALLISIEGNWCSTDINRRKLVLY